MNLNGVNNSTSFKGIMVVKGSNEKLTEITGRILDKVIEDSKGKTSSINYQFKCLDLKDGIRVFATKDESFGLRNFTLDAKSRGLEKPDKALYKSFYENISRYVANTQKEEKDADEILNALSNDKFDIENLNFVA